LACQKRVGIREYHDPEKTSTSTLIAFAQRHPRGTFQQTPAARVNGLASKSASRIAKTVPQIEHIELGNSPPSDSDLTGTMSSNSGAPLFQFNNNGKSKEPLFASNVTSNGLFSAQSTPESNRFLDSPDSRSLFAGATPGVKSGSKSAGSLFSAGGKPTFNLGPVASAGPSSNKQTSSFGLSPPKATGTTGMFGEGESTEIYEDDSRDEDMEQDEDESGMYGDEEEEDYTEEESSVMEESNQPGNKPGPYVEMIGPPATEPGALIIKAEELMEELERLMSPPRDDEYDPDEDMDFDMDRRAPSLERQQEYLGKASKDFLTALHAQLSKSTKAKADRNLRYAYYIASLILPLHHATSNTTEVLRKWIFTHHPEPSRSHLTSVRGTHPNSALSVDFWDVVYRLTIRGEVQEAAEVLRSANWDFLSEDAPPVSQPAFGAAQKLNDKRYPQAEIESIKTAVATAISLLERCPGQGRSAYQPSSQFFPMAQPAVDHPGSPADWRIWRGEVLKASEEIKGIAMEDDEDPEETYYDAYNPQTGRGGSFGFARASKPKMKVPSAISRHLRAMYDVMRGDQDAITSTADNWQEATVSLMMWTKDADSAAADEEEEFEDNVAHHSQNMNPGEYYSVMMHRKKRQLAQLSAVMDVIVEEIPPNPTDRLETAICGVLANDPLYIAELEKYSSLIAATIVEIGGWAGWIKREITPKDNIANGNNMGLDEDDFAVLGMGAVDTIAEGKLAEDAIRRWGSRLFGTEWIDEDAEVEGWEIGIGPIARTKDGRRLNAKVSP
jgi:hypothetical protein